MRTAMVTARLQYNVRGQRTVQGPQVWHDWLVGGALLVSPTVRSVSAARAYLHHNSQAKSVFSNIVATQLTASTIALSVLGAKRQVSVMIGHCSWQKYFV